jgi:hypothetical protein
VIYSFLYLLVSGGFCHAQIYHLKRHGKKEFSGLDCALLVLFSLVWPYWIAAVGGCLLLKRSEE